MDPTGFSWIVTRLDDASVLRAAGDLDLASVEEFRAGLAEAMAEPTPLHVVIDLQDIDFCDSSGLNALIWAANRVEETGGRLVLRGLRPRMARLLRMTGLDRRFAASDA